MILVCDNLNTHIPNTIENPRNAALKDRILRDHTGTASGIFNRDEYTKGAFYETFEPEAARSLVKRLEFCHTPKHGSWLNVAENELSALTRQCVQGRRFETIEKLRDEVAAWATHCNAKQKGVQWQLKVKNARIKLHSLYPKIKS